MNSFFLDANALVKRYIVEKGSPLVGQFFHRVPRERLMSLMLGVAEVVAAPVRKCNGGSITPAEYAAAMLRFRAEVLNAADFAKLAADNPLIEASIPLLDKHGINSSDAIALQATLTASVPLRSAGNDVVLAASDQRLLRAAQSEGLITFDPETQGQMELDQLLGP